MKKISWFRVRYESDINIDEEQQKRNEEYIQSMESFYPSNPDGSLLTEEEYSKLWRIDETKNSKGQEVFYLRHTDSRHSSATSSAIVRSGAEWQLKQFYQSYLFHFKNCPNLIQENLK